MDSSSTLHSVTPCCLRSIKKEKKKRKKKRVYLQNSCGSACTSSSERSSDLQQFSITSQEARPQCVSSFSLELMAAARPEVAHQRKAVVMRMVSCRQNIFFVKRIVCSRFKCHISFWTRQQALGRSKFMCAHTCILHEGTPGKKHEGDITASFSLDRWV